MNEWIIIQATAQPSKGLYNRHLLSWRIQSESEKLSQLSNPNLNPFLQYLLNFQKVKKIIWDDKQQGNFFVFRN